MRVAEAKSQVLGLIRDDINTYSLGIILQNNSDDGDDYKLMLDGKRARVIHPRDGFYAKVSRTWFHGGDDLPEINKGQFYWYVLALRERNAGPITTYYLCDYHTMRSFVLGLQVPNPEQYHSQSSWRGELHIISDKQGYFRWGDESKDFNLEERYVRLRNLDIAANKSNPSSPTKSGVISRGIAEAADDLGLYSASYTELPNTEQQAIIDSRIGQGIFRQQLELYWNGCAVTSCSDPRILRASHIKPWRDSNNIERLAVHNGLLLIPNLDATFDAGLISFDCNGQILISSELDSATQRTLGISPKMKLRHIEEQHRPYLTYHNSYVFKNQANLPYQYKNKE